MPTTNAQRAMTPAERFFWQHAGYGYAPGRETRAQGRRRGAVALAAAEAYATAHDWRAEWVYDPDDGGDGDVTPDERYGCILCDADGAVLASLWSIGDPDANYRRVVAAELALEAMPDDADRAAAVEVA